MRCAVIILAVFLFTGVQRYVYADEPGREDAGSKSEADAVTSRHEFNPSLTLAFDFSGVYRSIDNDAYRGLSIPGFYPDDYDDHEDCKFNKNRGFNLNYGDLAFFGPVDRVFELTAILHFTERKLELEEIFFKSGFLPWGLYLQVGKFMSGFGRLNSQRHHEWPFAEPPVIYLELFGVHCLNEKGARLAWSHKGKLDYHIGGEILYGDNSRSFGTEGFSIGSHHIDDSNGVPLHCGFAKLGYVRGPFLISLDGSVVFGYSRIDQGLDAASPSTGFADFTHVFIYEAGMLIKYHYSGSRYLMLQSEYLYKTAVGHRYFSSGKEARLTAAQSGLYIDFSIAVSTRINAGVRFDLIQKNDVDVSGLETRSPGGLPRYSIMTEIKASDYSRVRLQYSHDRTARDTISENRVIYHQLVLEYTMILGLLPPRAL